MESLRARIGTSKSEARELGGHLIHTIHDSHRTAGVFHVEHPHAYLLA